MIIFAARRIAKAAAARHNKDGDPNGQRDQHNAAAVEGDILEGAAVGTMVHSHQQQNAQPQYAQQEYVQQGQAPPPYSVSPQQSYAPNKGNPQPPCGLTSYGQGQQPLMSYGNAAPPPMLIGLDASFCFNQPVTLLVDEHLTLATPESTVFTMQGTPVVQCVGKMSAMGFHVPGQSFPALTLEGDKFSIGAANFHLRTRLADAEIKGRFTLLHGSSTSFAVKFDNAVDGRHDEVRLESRGEFGGGDGGFEVVARDTEVGRKRDKRDMVVARGRTLGQRYEVDVQVGMDVAVVVAMVVCLNERRGQV